MLFGLICTCSWKMWIVLLKTILLYLWRAFLMIGGKREVWLLIKSRETEVGSENVGSNSLNTRAGDLKLLPFVTWWFKINATLLYFTRTDLLAGSVDHVLWCSFCCCLFWSGWNKQFNLIIFIIQTWINGRTLGSVVGLGCDWSGRDYWS